MHVHDGLSCFVMPFGVILGSRKFVGMPTNFWGPKVALKSRFGAPLEGSQGTFLAEIGYTFPVNWSSESLFAITGAVVLWGVSGPIVCRATITATCCVLALFKAHLPVPGRERGS